mmetsp:Transcript_47849/g.113694  ORF Transcript_47849/g.113694 Transcript_47849/m.113694 type:complete len:865 (+) Transcript_47849:139-2733(+)
MSSSRDHRRSAQQTRSAPAVQQTKASSSAPSKPKGPVRADNGMDAYTVLGVTEASIDSLSDLAKLHQKSRVMFKDFMGKSQKQNAKRVQWAIEQVTIMKKREFKAREASSGGGGGDVPSSSGVKRPASKEDAAAAAEKRREIIREKAAARRAQEQPEVSERQESIREKLAAKRVCKKVPVLKLKESKAKVVELMQQQDAAGGAGSERVSLTCPLSLTRISTPARGAACQHLQCFDLETFVWRKEGTCPVCGLTLETPLGLLVDAYMTEILSKVQEKGNEVTFDADGGWKIAEQRSRKREHTVIPEPSPAPEPELPEFDLKVAASPFPMSPYPMSPFPMDEDEEGAAPAEASPEGEAPPAEEAEEDQEECDGGEDGDEKEGSPQSGDADAAEEAPASPPAPSPPPAPPVVKEKFQVDPQIESSYFAVELKKPMGIFFQANFRSVGGVFMESFEGHGAAARHSGLKVGDQLVGVGATSAMGLAFDNCIDRIVEDPKDMTMLTIFRGPAADLYGEYGPDAAWIAELLRKVEAGEIAPVASAEPPRQPEAPTKASPAAAAAVPTAAAAEEASSPVAEESAPKKRKKEVKEPAKPNPRLSIGAADDEEAGSEEELEFLSPTGDAAVDGEEGEEEQGERDEEDDDPALPDCLLECIKGEGLDADVQRCALALPALGQDEIPKELAQTLQLVRCILRQCIKRNSSAWEAQEQEQRAPWKKEAARRLSKAAKSRVERLKEEVRRRQETERKAALEAAAKEARELEASRLLKLDPARKVQFDWRGTADLKLRNQSSDKVAFRLRTSAPKLLVQPAHGRLAPNETVNVHIQRTGKCEFKLLVQAVVAAGRVSKEDWEELDEDDIQEWHLGEFKH